MMEEPGAGAYTHANEIYISENWLEAVHDNEERYREAFDDTIAHEVFHVLTRNDRNFKENMYRLIGFTLDSSEPDFSPEVRERILANPDVESYDAHATFTINGEPTDGVIVSYFDGDYKDGRVMLDSVKTGVVPVDKPDRIVPIEEIPDFYDVVGHNTDYVIAAEEVLADNFSYAMTYGKDADYANPELIEGMLEYLSTGKTTERVTGILEEVAEAQGLSVEELAQEVIKGLWGNGTDRVEALEGAGYDAGAVQKEVNEMMGD
ncbi:MAG: hypothetical protein K5770_01880 [Lachnospiraceae bacterium]|nr:hypothetical protein [Lachnospiraceae bacterium]